MKDTIIKYIPKSLGILSERKDSRDIMEKTDFLSKSKSWTLDIL